MDLPKIEIPALRADGTTQRSVMPVGERAGVLIVDDTPAKLVALGAIVSGMALEIVTATSGEQALRQLLKRDFAVILLDVIMPTMDGFETAALIRSRKQSEVTPIIFVTADARSERDMLHGYSQGAVDYVFTPIIPEILRAKVSVFVDLFHKTREIKRHEQRLHEKNLELEATNKELEAFSHSVSHDLRAPLRHIDGFSRILLENHGAQLDQQGKEYLERVCGATRRMSQLIDDMLHLSRVTRAEMRREETDLAAIALEIAAELGKNHPERSVEFEAAQGLTAQCDPRLSRIALENLLGNAWKFTGKCDRARVEFGMAERDGKPVYFVRDNGAGFDMAYVKKLFGAFQRLHSDDEFPGTGIGLATVQRIVHRHGGRIWAEAEIGKGAAFYFTL